MQHIDTKVVFRLDVCAVVYEEFAHIRIPLE